MVKIVKEKWINLGLKGAGAAFSGTVLGFIKPYVGVMGLGDEILTAGVGFILEEGWLIKNKYLQNFGEGMLIAGLSQIFSSWVGGGGTIKTVEQARQTKQRTQLPRTSGIRADFGPP